MIDRRTLLASGLAALTGILTKPARAAEPEPTDWAARIAHDFERLDRSQVQLAGFLLAPHPRPVSEAIARHRAALDANPTTYLYANNRRLEAAVRTAAANSLGTRSDHLALTDSTTMGLGLVYGAIEIRADQEILTTEHDHYATHAALQLRSRTSGAPIRRIALYEDIDSVTVEAITGRIRDAIRPTTRVLALTWVHSSTGLKLPLRAIADVVAEANFGRARADRVLLCVDGAHGLGVDDVSLPSLGCDVLVAGTHKWLCGPRGTGIVWASHHGRRALAPIIPTFSGDAGWGGLMTPGGFHSFENRWALADAFRWRASREPKRIEGHVHALARRLKEGLASIPGVRVATPLSDELSAGIVSFDVGRLSAQETERRLLRRGIVTKHAPYERSYARFAPMVYTTADEVDRALNTVDPIA